MSEPKSNLEVWSGLPPSPRLPLDDRAILMDVWDAAEGTFIPVFVADDAAGPPPGVIHSEIVTRHTIDLSKKDDGGSPPA